MKKYIKKQIKGKYIYIWLIGLITPAFFSLMAQHMNAKVGEDIINGVVKGKTFLSILVSCLLVLLGFSIAQIGWGITKYIFNYFKNHVECEMKYEVFKKVISLEYSGINNLDTGNLFMAFNADAQKIVLLITDDLADIIYSIVMGVGISALIMLRNILLGIIVLALVIIVLLFNSFYVKLFKRLEKEERDIKRILMEQTSQVLKAKDTIRVMNLQKVSEYDMNEKSQNLLNVSQKVAFENLKKALKMDWFVYGCATLILPVACILVSLNIIYLPGVVYIIQLTGNIIWCAGTLGTALIEYNKNKVAFEEIEIFMQSKEENMNEDIKLMSEDLNSEKVLEIRGISINYDDFRPVRDISFTCNRGTITAINGASGSGKSSILNAIMGFTEYDGQVKLFGKEISKENIRYFRKYISYVSEQCELDDETILHNIELGNSCASEIDIVKLLKSLHMDEFIKDDKVVDIKCGVNSEKLSGGQRQRISIIRALVKNSPIFLLDEPTSALDDYTEDLVLELLKRLKKDGSTVLMVTHRIKTMAIADQIITI